MSESLFERIGGEGALMAAVHSFYARVRADPYVAPFFSALDMEAQTRKQVSFMAHVLGGPQEYHGRDLTEAHARMVADEGLDDGHFDAVVGHLKATLEELEIVPSVIDEVMAVAGGTRNAVLGRTRGLA